MTMDLKTAMAAELSASVTLHIEDQDDINWLNALVAHGISITRK